MADVMKRLEEIESRARQNQTYFSDSHYFSEEPQEIPEDVAYLLKLTRALLESQGELMAALLENCKCAVRGCPYCYEVIARAEKVRKGEV